MKQIYTFFLFFLAFTVTKVNAQCPTPTGMVATPINLNGSCFINIQFAIPNSNVSIYNASGFIAQGNASATGAVLIPYACSANPITSIVSIITNPTVQVCNTFTSSPVIVLPVKLSSFSVQQTNDKTALVKWETEMELNNDRFEIQKSTDGVNFITIHSLQASGNSYAKRAYAYDDRSFLPGATAFYRIRQVDNDGKTSYSKIAFISDRSNSNGDYSVFPNPYNPSNGTLQIKGIAASEINKGTIRISDMTGRPVAYSSAGANSLQIDPSAPAGMYIININDKSVRLLIRK